LLDITCLVYGASANAGVVQKHTSITMFSRFSSGHTYFSGAIFFQIEILLHFLFM